MNVQVEYILVTIILWIMSFLIRAGKLHFLILRYEAFQKAIRNRSFTINEEELTKFYSYVFLTGGLLTLLYPFTIDILSPWSPILLFGFAFTSILYLNMNEKFLIFET